MYALRIDGSPYLFTMGGISTVNVWDDGDNPGQTIVEGVLDKPTGDISERLRPLEGELDSSALSFVLHDLPNSGVSIITDLFTRGLNNITKSYATASVALGDTSITVADPSLFVTPCDAWIGQECVRVNSKVGSVLNVTRARYGSRAQAYAYDPTTGVAHEIFLSCPFLTRRRVTLYRVRESAALGWVAYVRWIGYADHAPRLNEDGASWTLSCVPVWQREANNPLTSQTAGAVNDGFDAKLIKIQFTRANDQGRIGAYGAGPKVQHHPNFQAALNAQCLELETKLRAAGGTNVRVTGVVGRGKVTVTCACNGLDEFELCLTIGDVSETANSNTTGNIRATVEIQMSPPTALTRVAFAGVGFPADRFTDIKPRPTMPTSDSSWTASQAGYAQSVTSTALLCCDWEDYVLELDPRGMSAGTIINANDTTNCSASRTTIKAAAKLRSKDPAVRLTEADKVPESLMESKQWRREIALEADHWLYGLRWLLTDQVAVQSNSDTRNWDWTGIVRAAAATGGGTIAGAAWRVGPERNAGEFIANECMMRGACVGTKNGKLTIVAVQPPNAATTAAQTITTASLRTGMVPQWEDWADGLVTAVQVNSPLRELRVIDSVSRARYGDGATLTFSAEGLRSLQSLIDDPIAACRTMAQRPLRLWSDPVYLVRLPLTVEFAGVLNLGDVVQLTQPVIPDGLGARGVTNTKALVIGITESFAGSIDVYCLIFATTYGYAPCARVSSIAGSQLTLASAYAGSAGDYAGSGLSGYQGTAGDKGASMFAVGDKVQLIQRDTATYNVEEHEVASVDTLGGKINLVAAPTAPWAGYSLVDVRYSTYTNCTTTQRAAYAFISDSATPPVIIAGVGARKWAP